ncbi:MAG: DNA topoisomerase III [Clostridiales bacterium]|jgi:DNA topoisomerase-3|nr:DNA topoisomerase III [Clostridiales bacterium]
MKTLVVAEKPSVGRDIARVLKCAGKAEGFLYSDDYIVSWAIGHLVTLCEPEDYDPALKRWRMETLPIAPLDIQLKPIVKTKKQLTVLKKLMNGKEVDSIVCATDSGREGELIFRYIYQIVKCKKPVKRLWISSMTDSAILAGFSSLKDSREYDSLYASAKCRSEADWLVGMNASRAFTIKYRTLLTIGRVQTPTLAIMTARQKEIDRFVPKDYWEVAAYFCKDLLTKDNFAGNNLPPGLNKSIYFTGTWFDPKTKDSKIFDKEKAENIAKSVRKKPGIVFDIQTERKKIPPGQLYDLTELQRDANKRFGFSAQKTLGIAQTLYEKRKLVTYPRTDSRCLSTDMIPKLEPTLKTLDIEPYKPFVAYVLALNELPITKRVVDNSKISDHHAIIPTGKKPNLQILAEDERKIYDLIARKFIAVFYPVYVYDIVKIISVAESENFLTKGNIIIQPGWTELFPQSDSEDILPNVKKGDPLLVADAKSIAKKTQPPKPYTEATLLSAMENAGRFTDNEELAAQLKESGLGTPATRAAIIERLLTVGYIIRKGKNLTPTEKGMKLIDVVPSELKSPETTGKWEKGLSSIAKSNMIPEKFMSSIGRYVDYIIKFVRETECATEFPIEERKPYRPKKAVAKR